jgi:tRNA A-37 threonylcarbamoyl transferase component Bud32
MLGNTKLSQQEFDEQCCFIKENVEFKEYAIHAYVENLKIINVPKIISYDADRKILVMQKIDNMSISDFYGENTLDVPEKVLNEIREAVTKLYQAHVEYPDITGYNFIRHNKKLWLIDFGHAKYNNNYLTYDPHISTFITGTNKWNKKFL